jgi:peptidoglycan-N-acetylglucosamine deacetylase
MISSRQVGALACAVVAVAVFSGPLRPAVAAAGGESQLARAARSCPSASYGAHRYAPGRGKTVALTFDDGPGRSTAAILKVLARYRVLATFFNLGVNVAARPGLVRREVRARYVMGDHTWDHPDMDLLPAASQAREIDRMSAELKAVAHVRACLFRPPYGNYDAVTLRLARERRMSVWLWSVDTLDWMARGSGSSYWVSRIVRLAEREGGALRHPVVLMHNQPNGNPATVTALPVVIRFFRSHGYRFVLL